MDKSDHKRFDEPDLDEGGLTNRREFLQRFAALSAASVLLGVSAACCPVAVYGPAPDPESDDVYGPPPDEEPEDEEEEDAEAVYGPPPDGE